MPDTQHHFIDRTTVIDCPEDIRNELEECNNSISTLNIELNECITQLDTLRSEFPDNYQTNCDARAAFESGKQAGKLLCPNFLQKCLPLIIINIIMIMIMIIILLFFFKNKKK